MIEGRNAVQEALKTERPIDKIYVAKGHTDRTLG
ncbi:MAG: 23S rRNA (guanosine(2251)-2'-O)-methyltransferase RlmB, partial [Clostridiales bacterium]|nr:23S rRNA (guanosine(2251)-2'-O)-methyltransferase RlmB [Candidatus Apopatocola equi]